MKQIYWGVMRGDRKQFPHSLYTTYRHAKSLCLDLNKLKNGNYWIKRFEINLKGKAIDMYKHEYERRK